MVCGGFACSRNSLIVLNLLYIIVSFILIGVAAYSCLASMITSLGLVGALIACGVFLFIIALNGLIGAAKHHQVLLFFYMIVLFLLFLLQFSLACACLAVNSEQEMKLARTGWSVADNKLKQNVQYGFDCCGFQDVTLNSSEALGHPSCDGLPCCEGHGDDSCCSSSTSNITSTASDNCNCQLCGDKLKSQIHNAFSVSGGIGLFFSFTEIVGVWLAMRYRNQKDPRANPSAFL